VQLLRHLRTLGVETHLLLSAAGVLNVNQELGLKRADVEALADSAAHEVEGGERERIGEEDPLLARQAETEILLDRREGDDDHRRVDERERRAEDGGGERQPPPRLEAERLHGRRIR